MPSRSNRAWGKELASYHELQQHVIGYCTWCEVRKDHLDEPIAVDELRKIWKLVQAQGGEGAEEF
eukprot:scaffold120711_cov32-Tisochrysis_lutea.AAC.3